MVLVDSFSTSLGCMGLSVGHSAFLFALKLYPGKSALHVHNRCLEMEWVKVLICFPPIEFGGP
jgi:hypothetical protein